MEAQFYPHGSLLKTRESEASVCPPLKKRWTYQSGGKVGAIAVCGNVAYLGCGKKGLEAVDLQSGSQLWQTEIEGVNRTRSPMVALEEAVGVVLPGGELCRFWSADNGDVLDLELPIDLDSFAPYEDFYLARRYAPEMAIGRFGTTLPFERRGEILRDAVMPRVVNSESAMFGFLMPPDKPAALLCLDPTTAKLHWRSEEMMLLRDGSPEKILAAGHSVVFCRLGTWNFFSTVWWQVGNFFAGFVEKTASSSRCVSVCAKLLWVKVGVCERNRDQS